MICISSAHDVDETTRIILAERPFLERLAGRIARCGPDADDLVQETLLRAYVARDRFQRGTSIRAWLATILRRLFLTAAAKDRRRNTPTDTDAGGVLTASGGPAVTTPPPAHLSPEAVLERVEDPVKRAFGRLPEVYRRPFLMFALDGLSYAEIADLLSVPVGTIMSRIHRARTRLKGALQGVG